MWILYCWLLGSDRDIVLMYGVEFNMCWWMFCAELLVIVDKFNVDIVVILGVLFVDILHIWLVLVSIIVTGKQIGRAHV